MRSPGFHFECHALAGFQQLAVSHGFDFGLLRLFLGGVGNDDSAAALFAFFQPFDQNAVVQGT